MRCFAEVGLVDRLRGGTVLENVTLDAVVVGCCPGADGVLYKREDVLSLGSVLVTLTKEDRWLRNQAAIAIPLGAEFQTAFLCLTDANGAPFATGAIHIRGASPAPQVVEIAAGDLVLHQRRTH